MQAKQPKTPPINSGTTILCFDLETNGLHGEAFAAGAVVMDAKGKIKHEFTGRTNIVGPVDAWVEKNVVPVIHTIKLNHKSSRDLREAFWKWYLEVEPDADYVLVSNGYPVEYRFLLQCQEENITERYWQHPFPILDLSSMLLAAGQPPSLKNKMISQIMKEGSFARHNPLDDAKISALTAFALFRQTGRIV